MRIHTDDAILEEVVEGQSMSPSPGRVITPITIRVLVGAFTMGNVEIKGYRDSTKGKITYSKPITDSGMDKCISLHKPGDKIKLDIESLAEKRIIFTGR